MMTVPFHHLCLFIMGGLIEVFLDPVHGLGDRTVAALLFQPLQAGQQPIADEGLLPADRFQLLVLPPAPPGSGPGRVCAAGRDPAAVPFYAAETGP